MLNDLFNIQYSRMINYSTVADQKMLNSGSLVVKLNFIHTGCFRVCSGGGVGGGGGGGGEFPLPQALIFYFSNFPVTRPFCPIILLHSSLFPVSFALLFILFPLHFILTFLLLLLLLLLLFHFLFLPFCCQFQRIFANFSPGAEGGGGFFGLRGEGRGGGGILDSLRPIPNERNFS